MHFKRKMRSFANITDRFSQNPDFTIIWRTPSAETSPSAMWGQNSPTLCHWRDTRQRYQDTCRVLRYTRSKFTRHLIRLKALLQFDVKRQSAKKLSLKYYECGEFSKWFYHHAGTAERQQRLHDKIRRNATVPCKINR